MIIDFEKLEFIEVVGKSSLRSIQEYTHEYPLIATYVGPVEGKFGSNFSFKDYKTEEIIVIQRVHDLDYKLKFIKPGTIVKVFCDSVQQLENNRTRISVKLFAINPNH